MGALFAIVLSLLAIFLILLVLVQRGRGGGLAGALGGMGGSSAFGAKAGDVFTRITIITASIWIAICLLALFWAKHRGDALGTARADFAEQHGHEPADVDADAADGPAAPAIRATPRPATPRRLPANPPAATTAAAAGGSSAAPTGRAGSRRRQPIRRATPPSNEATAGQVIGQPADSQQFAE